MPVYVARVQDCRSSDASKTISCIHCPTEEEGSTRNQKVSQILTKISQYPILCSFKWRRDRDSKPLS